MSKTNFYKLIIIISIALISIHNIDWSIEPEAKSFGNNTREEFATKTINPYNPNDFEFGDIKVISEPIFGQDINTQYSSMSKIAIEDEKIYIVWEDSNDTNGAGTDWDIFYRFFDGNTWSEIQVISEPLTGNNINNGGSSNPHIAVENGKIYVVWQDSTDFDGAGTDPDIFYRCNLTGSKWEDIQVISEPVPGQNVNIWGSLYSRIAVENDKIYIAWHDINNTNNAGLDMDIFFRCNLTGSHWEDVQVISEPISGLNTNPVDSTNPEIAVDNGIIYVVWSDYNNTNGAGGDLDIFFICNSTGSYWEPIQVISEPVLGSNFNTGESDNAGIAVENGNIYVVWQDENDTDDAGEDKDIFFRCQLTGSDWSQIQVISEQVLGQNINIERSTFPEIAIENNRIYVIWEDRDNFNSAGSDQDVFFRCSYTISNWMPIQVISEPIIGANTNIAGCGKPDIAIKNGKSHTVWHDNNNTNGAGGDHDICYRWLEDPSLPFLLSFPTVTPIFGNTSTDFNFTVTYIHYNNTTPSEMSLYISESKYSMLEVNPADNNHLDGKDYFFNIKNLDIGVHTYQVYASDGEFTHFTAIVNKPEIYNSPPNIETENNLTAYEDDLYFVDYNYKDIDELNVGQQINLNWNTDAPWLHFDYATGILNGTPSNDDVGEYWVNISVFDTIDTDSTNFTLTVIGINDDPIITTDNVEFTYEDELYEVDYNSMDVDSLPENQEWMLETNASSWLTMESDTGIISGIPTNDDVGTYWVNVSVHDGIGGLSFTNFTLTVLNVNDPPVITTEDITLASVGILYEVDYNATDIDSLISNFEWYLTSNASWLTIDSTTGLLSGTPTEFDTGLFHVNVTVHDGDNGFDWHDYSIGVTRIPINAPPVITTKDTLTTIVGELYYIDYEAIDDRTPVNELLWDTRTNATWLIVEKTTGVLKGTPTVNDVGWYWVNLSVYDGEGGKTYHNFTITVYLSHDLIPVPNTAPTLFESLLSPLSGRANTDFTFSVRYFDLDGDSPAFIQIVLDGTRYNMTFTAGNTSNGIYKYRTRLSEGEHIYHFTASDGEYTVNTNNFTTPYIEKEGDVSTGKMSNWVWVLVIIVVIVVIVAVMFFVIIRKKRQKEETLIPEPITLRPILRPTPPVTTGYAASMPKPSQSPTVTTLKAPLTTQHLPGQEPKDHLMLPPSQSEPSQKQQIQDLNQMQSQQQQQLHTPHTQQLQTLQQNQQVPDQQPPASGETKLEGWDIQ